MPRRDPPAAQDSELNSFFWHETGGENVNLGGLEKHTFDLDPSLDSKTIYFFCLPQGSGQRPAYQYQSIVIAQGLKALGVRFFSNLDYWRPSPASTETLFKRDPNVSPSDCDAVLIPCQWDAYGQPFPSEILSRPRRFRTVYLDVNDGLFTTSFSPIALNFDVILKQKTRGVRYPSNCAAPWAFGLADHVIQAAQDTKPFHQRLDRISVNFRNPQPIRDLARERFLKRLTPIFTLDERVEPFEANLSPAEFFSRVSGGRHHPAYIQRLLSVKACAAFGGGFILPWPFDRSRLGFRFGAYLAKGRGSGRIVSLMRSLGLRIRHTYSIYQWDSFRLWESFAAGCVTLHVDFEKYGVHLPCMPRNWEHYVGVDLGNPMEAVERILDEPERLEIIAAAGRAWAIENYGPVPSARRFLEAVFR